MTDVKLWLLYSNTWSHLSVYKKELRVVLDMTSAFDGKAPAMVLGGISKTPSLPWLPGQLWPGVVASARVPFMGQIELFDEKLFNYLIVLK